MLAIQEASYHHQVCSKGKWCGLFCLQMGRSAAQIKLLPASCRCPSALSPCPGWWLSRTPASTLEDGRTDNLSYPCRCSFNSAPEAVFECCCPSSTGDFFWVTGWGCGCCCCCCCCGCVGGVVVFFVSCFWSGWAWNRRMPHESTILKQNVRTTLENYENDKNG